MKNKIGMTILLSLLLLSLLVVPVAGAADGVKALVKEMVQAPGEYSVGLNYFDYYTELMRWEDGGWQYMLRNLMTDFRLFRLGVA